MCGGQACGILETIRISAAGFPSRFAFEEFLSRYDLLAPREKAPDVNDAAAAARANVKAKRSGTASGSGATAGSRRTSRALPSLPTSAPSNAHATTYEIPALALSAVDAAYYRALWKHAVEGGSELPAVKAASVFNLSGLDPGTELRPVWMLAKKAGTPQLTMNETEFARKNSHLQRPPRLPQKDHAHTAITVTLPGSDSSLLCIFGHFCHALDSEYTQGPHTNVW